MVETGDERQEGGGERGGRESDGASPLDPMGVRAVEIRERGSERVETNGRDADGRRTDA